MKIKEITTEGLGAAYKIIKTGPEGTVLQSPDMHTQLQLDPEASKNIVKNPQNPNQFTMNAPAATSSTGSAQAPAGPQIGAEVEIPANEELDDNVANDAKEIGGDPTDAFIDDVVDQEFEKAVKPQSSELNHIRSLAGL
jgi:hypothetical protein